MLAEIKLMRKYSILGYVILLTIGLAIMTLASYILICLLIDVIFYNDGNKAKYDWYFPFGIVASAILTTLVYLRRVKKNRIAGNRDAIMVWKISYGVVLLASVFCLGKASYYSTTLYLSRNQQHSKIASLQDLMEHGDEFSDDTLDLPDKRIDSASFAKDLNATLDNTLLKWQEMVSDNGDFSIQFPNFQVKKDAIAQVINGKKVRGYSISLSTQKEVDPNLNYAVYYFPVTESKSVDVLFDNQKKTLLSNISGSHASERIIDSLGYPCRELFMTTDKQDITATTRMIYRQGRLYIITVLTDHDNLPNPRIYHFMNSFKFLQ